VHQVITAGAANKRNEAISKMLAPGGNGSTYEVKLSELSEIITLRRFPL